jgi:hypothetical protein
MHNLINIDDFFKAFELDKANDTKKTNFLIEYLKEHPDNNFVLNRFP